MFDSRRERRFFSSSLRQTGCGAHPAPYAVDTGVSFFGVNRLEHPHPYSAEVKDWSYISWHYGLALHKLNLVLLGLN
jgi:hypothetical protein